MTRNVILTVAANYGSSQIESFLTSWREHAGDAELVLFTKDCEASLRQACRDVGARTIEVTEPWRYGLLVGRHFVFRDFLSSNRSAFDNVLISDSRDVIFQSDPFTVRRDREVWFAAEDERIGGCNFNLFWMANVYGLEMAHDLGQETISCAGTTIGTCEGMLKYLELLCAEADSRPDATTTCGDQASHNYIFYRLRPEFIGLDRGGRIVQTLSHTLDARIAIGGDGVAVDGAVAPVLHQWDRHPKLIDYINGRYRLTDAPA